MGACDVRASWDKSFPDHDDEEVERLLNWAWCRPRPEKPGDRNYQEWAAARAGLLREARRRGLDLSEAKL